MKTKKRIGELLVEKGLLSEEALAEILETKTARIGEDLVEKGLVSKEDIGAALQSIMGVPYVECPPAEIDPKVLQLVPAAVAFKRCVLPLSVDESSRTLVVAMAEPQNVAHISELEFCSGMKISPRFSFRTEVLAGINAYYGEPPAKTYDEPAAKTLSNIPFVSAPIPDPASTQANPGYRASVIATFVIALVGGWASGFLYDSRHASASASPTMTATAASEPAPGPNPVETLAAVPAESSAATTTAEVPALPTPRTSPPAATLASANESQPAGPAPERNSPPSPTKAIERNSPPSPAKATEHNSPPSSAKATEHNSPPSSAKATEHNSPPSSVKGKYSYTLRVGVFRSLENAERLTRSLSETHDQARMVPLSDNLYSVIVGTFEDRETANQHAVEIAKELQLSPLVIRSAP